METKTENLCENQIELTEEPRYSRKKAVVFLKKAVICLLLVAVFIAYVYFLLYSFKNDGADLIRKLA